MYGNLQPNYGQQQQVPLPPGWEAKYDQQNRRWYFINHMTKKTQWTDPRQQMVQQQQQQQQAALQQQQQAQAALQRQQQEAAQRATAQARQAAERQAEQQRQQEALRRQQEAQKRAEEARKAEDRRQAALKRQQEEARQAAAHRASTSTPVQQQQAQSDWMQTMRQFGLDANTMNLVKDIMQNSDGVDIESTLKEMGIIKSDTTQASTSAEEVRQELTPRQKADRIEQMMKKFPKLTRDHVKMSLEAANYELDIAEALLQSQSSAKSTGRKRATVEPTTTTVTRPEAPRSYAPVVFGAEDDAEPKKTTSASKTSNAQISSFTDELPSTSRARTPSPSPRSPSPSPRTPSPSPTRRQRRTKVMANMDRYQPRSQPQVDPKDVYVSKLRVTPVGPNPANQKGPDPNAQIGTYTVALGPDIKNRKGPQASNFKGRDPSNYRGRAGLAIGSVMARKQ